jgi:hypothetical protein
VSAAANPLNGERAAAVAAMLAANQQRKALRFIGAFKAISVLC